MSTGAEQSGVARRGVETSRVATVSFVPGPAHVRPEILEAMSTPPVPHRSAAFARIVVRVQQGLADLLGTNEPVIPVLGSGTTSLEIALRAVARKRVLCLESGAFGQRTPKIAQRLRLDVETLSLPSGEAIDPQMAARAAAAGRFDTVTVVHNETSTGALTDVVGVARELAAQSPGTALIVDAVSSFGGVHLPFDDLGPLAMLVGVTGKCLACPPGMSVLAVGKEAAVRARTSTRGGYALDLGELLECHAQGKTPHTPNVPLFFALARQLDRILAEGMAARDARHREMAGLVQAWAEEHFEVLAAASARSPTVTAVVNTQAIDVAALLAATERRGFRIANGYGALKGATFRIGHLGDVTVAETRALLAVLDAALAEIA